MAASVEVVVAQLEPLLEAQDITAVLLEVAVRRGHGQILREAMAVKTLVAGEVAAPTITHLTKAAKAALGL
jgi:hypothetical protein